MKKFFFLFLVLLTSCQYMTDRSDQAALRKQCRIPEFARLINYNGFPWMNSFGQREGLNISATFLIDETRREEFERNAKDDGWTPLPISDEVLSKAEPLKTIGSKLTATVGLFRCYYAGNNVLHAEETQPCYFTTSGEKIDGHKHLVLNDMILSIYDSTSGEITAQISSMY